MKTKLAAVVAALDALPYSEFQTAMRALSAAAGEGMPAVTGLKLALAARDADPRIEIEAAQPTAAHPVDPVAAVLKTLPFHQFKIAMDVLAIAAACAMPAAVGGYLSDVADMAIAAARDREVADLDAQHRLDYRAPGTCDDDTENGQPGHIAP